jgi:hypothetical protein
MPVVTQSPESVAVGADVGHPRGTLAIVLIFGVLFALAWVSTYVFAFLGRGAPHQ